MESITRRAESVVTFILRQPSSNIAAFAALTSTTFFAAWVIIDFYAWTNFGTGGTPSTWAGYWRMTKIRVNHSLSGDDLRDASVLDAAKGSRYLPDDFEKKRRDGPRPNIITRTLPHRQQPYKASEVDNGVKARVAELCTTFGSRYENLTFLAPAKTEGGTAVGLYARKELTTLNPEVHEVSNKMLDGEIGHVHPADGSLHVWLSEGDARRVIEGGWGERFPLRFVHRGWIMVYAPRTMAQVEVVEEILRAAVGWVCGQKVA